MHLFIISFHIPLHVSSHIVQKIPVFNGSVLVTNNIKKGENGILKQDLLSPRLRTGRWRSPEIGIWKK